MFPTTNRPGATATRASNPIFKCNNNCPGGVRRGAHLSASYRATGRPGRSRVPLYRATDAIKREIAVVPTPNGGEDPPREEKPEEILCQLQGTLPISFTVRASFPPSSSPTGFSAPSPCTALHASRCVDAPLLLTREAPAAPIPSVSTASCPSRPVSV